jgi:hypothetical protein
MTSDACECYCWTWPMFPFFLSIFESPPLPHVAQPRPSWCRYQSPQLPRGDRGLPGIAQGAPPASLAGPSPPPRAPLPSQHHLSPGACPQLPGHLTATLLHLSAVRKYCPVPRVPLSLCGPPILFLPCAGSPRGAHSGGGHCAAQHPGGGGRCPAHLLRHPLARQGLLAGRLLRPGRAPRRAGSR